jgi:hypothetical protein
MKKTTLITCIIVLFVQVTFAQLKYGTYSWVKNPVLHTLPEADKNEPEIILKDKSAIEFVYDEKGTLNAYLLIHKITRVQSDDAIENNNKIYLPYSNANEIILQKARAITSTGKVLNLDVSDIKESTDEETNTVLRYFALEGLDIGCEVEYFYLLRYQPNIEGMAKVFQTGIPKRNIDFEIIAPKNLVFTAKSYNGLPEMQADTTNEEKSILTLHLDALPAIKEQPFSNIGASAQMLVYKLERNTYTGKTNLIEYGSVAESFYGAIYAELSKNESKKLDKLIDDMHITGANEEEKVRSIENYVKTNFAFLDRTVPDLHDISVALENKVTDALGSVRLFAHILSKQNIDHQIVLTSDRFDIKFDPEFEAYNFLSTYLIYFPKLNLYLEPAGKFSRLGFIPYQYTENYGLFIKPVEVGDYKTGIGKIKFIESVPHTQSGDIMNVTVTFGSDPLKPTITLKRKFTGYYADNIQTVYDFLDEKEQKQLTDQLVEFMSEDAEIEKIELKNAGGNNFPVYPLEVDAVFTSSAFVEKAGPKYLFKAGLLIGPQVEMYQEEERKLVVENDFNRQYTRTITFNIPEGYICKNLDALTFEVIQDINGKRTTQFISNYEVNGNTVTATIIEYYAQIIYQIEEFETFRKVVNAAADFNKVVLVFEKP